MKEYPVITIPKGQFIIIDGFLVRLDQRKLSDVSSSEAINLFNLKGLCFLRKLYNPNSLLKMQQMRSNYFLTSHSMLFQLMQNKTYIVFVKKKYRYYCRKTEKSRATHIAFHIKLKRLNGGFCSKYVVFDTPLRSYSYDACEIYEQQHRDLKHIPQYSIKQDVSLRSSCVEEIKAPDVLFISEEELQKMNTLPITKDKIERIARNTGEKCILKVEELMKSLLKLCFENSLWKLGKLKEAVRSDEAMMTRYEDVEKIFVECGCKISKNLQLITKQVFPDLIKRSLEESDHRKCRRESISERYLIIEGFLVDLKNKAIIDPNGDEFIQNSVLSEREKTSKYNLLDWDILRLSEQPFPVQSKELFEIVDCNVKEFFEDSRGIKHMKEGNDLLMKSEKYRCISLKLKNIGNRYIYEKLGSKICNQTQRKIEPEIEDEEKNLSKWYNPRMKSIDHEYLSFLEKLYLFSSYHEQRKLYVESFNRIKEMYEAESKNRIRNEYIV